MELLPMLRRAFSAFDPTLRRRLLNRVLEGTRDRARTSQTDEPAVSAAFERALPLLHTILGIETHG